MTDWVDWFKRQLESSGEGFVWAFQQIEPALHYAKPPAPHALGLWSPARMIWHVAEYERCLALASMQQWLGGSMPGEDAWIDNDETWAAAQDQSANVLIESFQSVRAAEIKLLDDLAAVDWDAPRETLWGMKPLSMVVTKTYQHTFEHGNTLMRMGLWWRDIEAEIAQQAQESANP